MAYLQRDEKRIRVVDDETAEWLRHTTPAQRIQMVGALNVMAREIVAAEIRRRWPDWTEAMIAKEGLRRLLADEACLCCTPRTCANLAVTTSQEAFWKNSDGRPDC